MEPAENINAVGTLLEKIIASGIGKTAAIGAIFILLYSFFENRQQVLHIILTNNAVLYGLGIATVLVLLTAILNMMLDRADKAARETSMLKDEWISELKIALDKKAELRQHILEIKAILEDQK